MSLRQLQGDKSCSFWSSFNTILPGGSWELFPDWSNMGWGLPWVPLRGYSRFLGKRALGRWWQNIFSGDLYIFILCFFLKVSGQWATPGSHETSAFAENVPKLVTARCQGREHLLGQGAVAGLPTNLNFLVSDCPILQKKLPAWINSNALMSQLCGTEEDTLMPPAGHAGCLTGL